MSSPNLSTTTFDKIRVKTIAISRPSSNDPSTILVQDPIYINTGNYDDLSIQGSRCKFTEGKYNYMNTSEITTGIIQPDVENTLYFTSKDSKNCIVEFRGVVNVSDNLKTPELLCNNITGLKNNTVTIKDLVVYNLNAIELTVEQITSEKAYVEFLKQIKGKLGDIEELTSNEIVVSTISPKKDNVSISKIKSSSIDTSDLKSTDAKIQKLEVLNLKADEVLPNNKSYVTIDTLKTRNITSDEISSKSIKSSNLKADSITTNTISPSDDVVQISKIKSDEITGSTINADRSKINELTVNVALVGSFKPIGSDTVVITKLNVDDLNAKKLTSNSLESKSIKSPDITVQEIKGSNGAVKIPSLTSDNFNAKKAVVEEGVCTKASLANLVITTQTVEVKDKKKLSVNNKLVPYEDEIEENYRKLFLYENTFKASKRAPARISIDSLKFKKQQKTFDLYVVSDDGNFIGNGRFVVDKNSKVHKVHDSQSGLFEYELTLENNIDIIIRPNLSFNPEKLTKDYKNALTFFDRVLKDATNNNTKEFANNTINKLKEMSNIKLGMYHKDNFISKKDKTERDKLVEEKSKLEDELEKTSDPLVRKRIQGEINKIVEKITAIDNANDNSKEDGEDSGGKGDPIDENKTFEFSVIIN